MTNCGGCFGAQCLHALAYSTYDRSIIDATKLLFDAGAKNCSIWPNSDDEEEATPWSTISTKCSYTETCENDYAMSNIFEAVYQLYQAVEDGRPYGGIDWYGAATGKKILRVLAQNDGY